MKKLFTFITLIAFALSMQAQLTNFSVGDDAPDFTVTDIHGHSHTLSTYTSAGKSVLIDFFFTTCGPCQTTAPKINDFYHKYGCNQSDVIVIGIDLGDSDAEVAAFEATYPGPNPYPSCSGLDGGGDAVCNSYGPAAYPTVCIIGADGKFKNTDVWPIGGVSDIESAFSAVGITITPMTCTSGMEDIAEEFSSRIYPNPTSDFTQVSIFAQTAANAEIEILNLEGKRIQLIEEAIEAGENKVAVSVEGMSAGFYFIRVSLNGLYTETFKLSVIE